MKFQVSPDFVRRHQRKQRWLAGWMLAVALGGVLAMRDGQLVWGLIVTLVGLQAAWSAWKASREGATSWPTFETRQEPPVLVVSYKDVSVAIHVAEVTQLRLQHKKGRLVSLLLHTAAGQRVRIEGYQDLDRLADFLRQHVPAERVVTARWLHR